MKNPQVIANLKVLLESLARRIREAEEVGLRWNKEGRDLEVVLTFRSPSRGPGLREAFESEMMQATPELRSPSLGSHGPTPTERDTGSNR